MFLEKKKKSRFKPFLRLLFFVLLIILICVILYAVFYSDLFRVQSFNFEYSNSRNDQSLGFFSNDFLISSLTSQIVKEKNFLGYLGSDNVLFWSLGRGKDLVNNNILPSVEKIDVKVNALKREIDILVEEKELTGIICKAENSCCAFNKEGRIFAPAPSVKGSLILRIDDINKRPLVLGERFLPKEKWIENLMKTVKVIKESGFYIESVNILEIELAEWEVVVSAGPKFLFSLDFVPDDLEEVMKTLKERADFSSIKYFDMRVKNRIYYK